MTMWLTPGIGHLFRIFLPFGSKKHSSASARKGGIATDSAAVFSERRQAQRRSGDPVQVLIAADAMKMHPIRGWVRDRSTKGLGLSCCEEVLPGTSLYVRAAFVPDDVAWIAIVVKTCQLVAGRWILGCEYVEPPPKEVLLLFR